MSIIIATPMLNATISSMTHKIMIQEAAQKLNRQLLHVSLVILDLTDPLHHMGPVVPTMILILKSGSINILDTHF